jgi:protoheme IX farnesyltransferase
MFVALALRLALSRAGETQEARTADGELYAVRPDARAARNLFAFSILYLFALFAALLVEHLARLAPLAPMWR